MPDHPPFRKIFPAVASRTAMFALTNRHSRAPFDENRVNGTLHAGEWFEVGEQQYDEMLNILPPVFLRSDMFAMSAFNGGKVAVVFLTRQVAGRQRWFLGFCDLAVPNSPEMLRDAIVGRETGADPSRLSRDEKLEVIWNATSWDFKGYADFSGWQAWSPSHIGRRTIVDTCGNQKTTLCLLEHLSDEQIARMLPDDPTYLAEIEGSGANPGRSGGDSEIGAVSETAVESASKPATKIVITHPDMGIYLGHCLGLGFWTLLDPAGQDRAVVFDSRDDARTHIASWESNNRSDDYELREVLATEGYATIPMLKAAGLAHLLGGMAYFKATIELLVDVKGEADIRATIAEAFRELLCEYAPDLPVVDWRIGRLDHEPSPQDWAGFEQPESMNSPGQATEGSSDLPTE